MIDDLLERGRRALAARFRATLGTEPFGIGSTFVVTQDDFISHPRVCLAWVRARSSSLLILEESGEVVALLCRHGSTP